MKNYLKYVEARGLSLGTPSGLEADSDFERELGRRLEAKGYTAEPQVGASGYRIDLGIHDPDRPGHYLAGIECDGAAYHSSKSARDRDRLREEQLRRQGWEILRVWSTDWFDDPERETEKLVKRLGELRNRQRKVTRAFILHPLEPADEQKSPGEAAEQLSAPATGLTEIVNDAETLAGSSLSEPRTSSTGVEAKRSEPPLLPVDVRSQLANLREQVIRPEVPDWTLQRSILRDAMIETFVSQRIDTADDWFKKVPGYLRQATNPAEKKYLDQICSIVADEMTANSKRKFPERGDHHLAQGR